MQILGQIWMQFNSLVDETWRGTRLVSHGGAVMGATAFLAMLPDHDLDVVVLANRPLDVESIAMQAAAAVLGDRIEAALKAELEASEKIEPLGSNAGWVGLVLRVERLNIVRLPAVDGLVCVWLRTVRVGTQLGHLHELPFKYISFARQTHV